MLKARKLNRVLRIPNEKADEYKELGYTISEMDGKILYQPEDKDATIAALKKENKQLKEENQKLLERLTAAESAMDDLNTKKGSKSPKKGKDSPEKAQDTEPADSAADPETK